ncbi:MAG: O-antigen ligase family protein [Oscillospiraceae bacterium]
MSTTWKESCCAQLLLVLWNLYEESWLKRHIVNPFEDWVGRKWNSSCTQGLILSEGILSRAWAGSLSCRALSAVLNLPAAALHWLYRLLRRPMEQSILANLIFDMGEEASIAVSWLFPALLLIPYSRWNNSYSFLAFAAALLLFYAAGMRSRSFRVDAADFGPYLVFFAMAVCCSVPLSHYPELSGRFLLYHAAGMLCVVVVVSSVQNAEQLSRLAAGASLGVLYTGLYGIYQRVVIGVEVNLSYVDLTYNADMPGRVYSVFDNPNTFAEALILLLPLSVALLLSSRRWWGRLLALAAIGAGGAALLMTYSRASWVGLFVGMVLFVFLWNVRLVPLCALLCVLAVPFLPTSVLNRILTITNFSDTSTSSRFPLYTATVAALKLSPIRGAGLGGDAVRQFIKLNELYHAKAPYVHSHNMVMQVWIETGLLGIVSFLGGVLWTLKATVRAVREKCSAQARLITIGGASAIAGSMVCGLADYLWNYPRVQCVFWFTVAVTLAGIKVCRRERTA